MILYKNIWHMLSYAYSQIKRPMSKESVTEEEFDNIGDLFGTILVSGIKLLIKKGMYKEYITINDSINTVKGKINLFETYKNIKRQKLKIHCSFSDLTYNTILNQILKAALNILLRSDINSKIKSKVKWTLSFFTHIKDINIKKVDWNIHFNKLNKQYEMLIFVCRLLTKNSILNKGNKYSFNKMINEDDIKKIYEKFILCFYKKEFPMLKANDEYIKWDIQSDDSIFLPLMKTDVILQYKNKVLIIDAKYYSTVLVQNFGKEEIRSSHLYQIFSYVQNYQKQNTNKKVSGMLLYAKSGQDTTPDNEYIISGNHFFIQTLDLNVEFTKIKTQLKNIVKREFNI